jgi:hypothetical protein
MKMYESAKKRPREGIVEKKITATVLIVEQQKGRPMKEATHLTFIIVLTFLS